MPIEIRELIIKTTVGGNTLSPDSGQSGSAPLSGLKEQDIALIVEKVLQILKEKSER